MAAQEQRWRNWKTCLCADVLVRRWTRAPGDPASLKIELRYPGEAVATHHRYRSSCDVQQESGHLASSLLHLHGCLFSRRDIYNVVTVLWVRGSLPCCTEHLTVVHSSNCDHHFISTTIYTLMSFCELRCENLKPFFLKRIILYDNVCLGVFMWKMCSDVNVGNAPMSPLGVSAGQPRSFSPPVAAPWDNTNTWDWTDVVWSTVSHIVWCLNSISVVCLPFAFVSLVFFCRVWTNVSSHSLEHFN